MSVSDQEFQSPMGLRSGILIFDSPIYELHDEFLAFKLISDLKFFTISLGNKSLVFLSLSLCFPTVKCKPY